MLLLRSRPFDRTARFGALGALAGTGALSLLCFAPFAAAEPSPALDRFSFSVGAFSADPKFSASVETPYGVLRSNELKPGRVTMPRISADVLIGDSQGLSFDYYRYKRDYEGQVAGNTSFGSFDSLSAIGNANLSAQLDFAKLAYKWWLGSGNTVFGLGAGAAYYRATLGASALVGVNGQVRSVSERSSDNAIAPLLEVGVRHAITPDLRLFADASGVWKSSGRFHGNIYNAAAGVEWFPVKNVGLVLSYGVTNIDLTREGGFADSRLKVRLQGPSAFLKARF
ncbi:hypothetical protein J2W25_004693 [Variovorax boronicumulans]|uniref:Autotransporter outer membrane beta-barrel domain-containing protein n=1 Tax=Variovorax boronicumulans TaxID=436515 RepID=A0AAW8E177_9BURK|nr:hypothetical protein [Variovorax boronicumulans]MDP9880364.1 hypothetical protein [Variovorax boronicumulans]MDP9918605.1 hypothetical protein [Variovorax boronicumulans]MDP9925650.1 hypothetical protein [Variovorax boronicumulans]